MWSIPIVPFKWSLPPIVLLRGLAPVSSFKAINCRCPNILHSGGAMDLMFRFSTYVQCCLTISFNDCNGSVVFTILLSWSCSIWPARRHRYPLLWLPMNECTCCDNVIVDCNHLLYLIIQMITPHGPCCLAWWWRAVMRDLNFSGSCPASCKALKKWLRAKRMNSSEKQPERCFFGTWHCCALQVFNW